MITVGAPGPARRACDRRRGDVDSDVVVANAGDEHDVDVVVDTRDESVVEDGDSGWIDVALLEELAARGVVRVAVAATSSSRAPYSILLPTVRSYGSSTSTSFSAAQPRPAAASSGTLIFICARERGAREHERATSWLGG